MTEINDDIYVPGHWTCPKCKFSLVQRTLWAQSGAITEHDKPGEKCRNCDTPLWRVTWKAQAQENLDRAMTEIKRVRALTNLMREWQSMYKIHTANVMRFEAILHKERFDDEEGTSLPGV